MVLYECFQCNKTFKQVCHYKFHINRKKPCFIKTSNNVELNTDENKPKNTLRNPENTLRDPEKKTEEKDDNKCKYCKMIFTRKDNLKCHIDRYCKKKEEFLKTESEIEKLKEENEKLKKILENKKNKNIIINNTYNNIDISNNVLVNNNIQLITFGQEDYHLLTDTEKKDIINSAVNSFTTYIKYTHFNENRPQNMNIYINNTRSNLTNVYECGKWKKYRTDNVTDMLISKSVGCIEKILNEYPNSNNFCIGITKDLIRDIDDDKQKIIKDQKERIKITLYNEKDKVIENKKLI